MKTLISLVAVALAAFAGATTISLPQTDFTLAPGVRNFALPGTVNSDRSGSTVVKVAVFPISNPGLAFDYAFHPNDAGWFLNDASPLAFGDSYTGNLMEIVNLEAPDLDEYTISFGAFAYYDPSDISEPTNFTLHVSGVGPVPEPEPILAFGTAFLLMARPRARKRG